MNESIKDLIKSIYECQKGIIIARRSIRDKMMDGIDTTTEENEIKQLEKEIVKFQKKLRKKYQFYY